MHKGNVDNEFSHSATVHSMAVPDEELITHTEIIEHVTISHILKEFNWSAFFNDFNVKKDKNWEILSD